MTTKNRLARARGKKSAAYLDNVERRPAPPKEVFWREYVLRQRPLIITDMFAGQPIARLRSLAQFSRRFGGLKIKIKPEAFSYVVAQFLRQRDKTDLAGLSARWRSYGAGRRRYTLAEYLSLVRQRPQSKKMCSEYPLPDEVRALFRLPDYCLLRDAARDGDLALMLFVGNAGNHAHLHFDGDYQQVLHYDVCGAKRFVLIPPREAKKLAPVGHFSGVMLEHFSDADKVDFLRYTNASECVLRPGETLFIPALMWHYVEYLDTSVSFNIRFGRNRYLRYLSEYWSGNVYTQNIAAQMLDEDVAAARYPYVFRELEALRLRKARDATAKYQQQVRLLRRLYRQVCPAQAQDIYALTEVAGLFDTYAQYRVENIYEPRLARTCPNLQEG